LSSTNLKYIILTYFFLVSLPSLSQLDTVPSIWFPDIEVTDKSFKSKYDSVKRRVLKVYPYALHAQSLLLKYKKVTEGLTKKRQIKKFGKQAQKQLKDDFKFIIREMYISEGKVLMKLIHRETSFTVREIIELYRGKMKASWYQTVGNMFHQNLSATYDRNQDWIIEMVLIEIEKGRLKVDPNPKIITKEQYKKLLAKRKKFRKELKVWKKKHKKKLKAKKKEESVKGAS